MWIERKALHVQESSTLEFYAIQPLETRRWCVWVENHDVVMIPHTTSILLSLVTISNVVQRPYSNLPINIAAFSYLLKKWRANWCLLREPLSVNQVPWIRSIYHIYHFLESDSEIELEPIRNAATLTSSTHSSRIETHVVRGGQRTMQWQFVDLFLWSATSDNNTSNGRLSSVSHQGKWIGIFPWHSAWKAQ